MITRKILTREVGKGKLNEENAIVNSTEGIVVKLKDIFHPCPFILGWIDVDLLVGYRVNEDETAIDIIASRFGKKKKKNNNN